MEGPTRVPGQPGADLGLLVGGIIVEDDMDRLVSRHLGLDGIEETDEFLMPVPLHVAPDHRSIQHVERGEQGGGAIAFIVVRHGGAAPALERQPWLGAIKRLDLALLIDRQHDGMGGRRYIKPDDILQLLGEGLVVGQLETAPPVRGQAVFVPDLHDRRRRNAYRLGHRTDRPVRSFLRRWLQRQRHDLLDQRGRQRGNAGGTGLVAQQAIDAFLHEPLLPAPHAGLGFPGRSHDRLSAFAPGGQQNDPSAPHMLLGCATRRDNRFKPLTVIRRDLDLDTCSHTPIWQVRGRRGSLQSDSFVPINPLGLGAFPRAAGNRTRTD